MICKFVRAIPLGFRCTYRGCVIVGGMIIVGGTVLVLTFHHTTAAPHPLQTLLCVVRLS